MVCVCLCERCLTHLTFHHRFLNVMFVDFFLHFCAVLLLSPNEKQTCVFVLPGTGLAPTAWQTVMKSRPAQVHQTRTTPPNSPMTLLEPRGETLEDLFKFLTCNSWVRPLTVIFFFNL